MRKRLVLLSVLLALIVAACTNTPVEEAALFGDGDLDTAGPVIGLTEIGGGDLAALTAPTENIAFARNTSTDVTASNLGLSTQASGLADTGGYLAYVEAKRGRYSVILDGLGNTGAPGKNGQQIVYSGRRPIQSVAVSNDGTLVAFLAESADGDNDLYLLDLTAGEATVLDTDADEQDISMSADGNVLVWQGETAAGPSLFWLNLAIGEFIELDSDLFGFFFGVPFEALEPSVSGNGVSVAFVDNTGLFPPLFGFPPLPLVNTLDFVVEGGTLTNLNLNLLIIGSVLEAPSLNYTGDLVLHKDVVFGDPVLSLFDLASGSFLDILVGPVVDHPYLAADGDHLTFGFGGVRYLGDIDGNFEALPTPANAVASATYWAKGSYTHYSGSNDEGVFVRPDIGGGLSDAGRTVPYHAFAFVPERSDRYEILSVQDYDGFLSLYEGSFDPNDPEANVIANNDDSGGGFDGTTGVSRIVEELKKNRTYVVVTSACGAAGTSCGPDSGTFSNTISDGADPPLPAFVLPPVDPTGYDITIRFTDETDAALTDEQKQVFIDAAERWGNIITGDLSDSGFALPAGFFFPDTAAVEGTLDDVLIDVRFGSLGGPLGRAGPVLIRSAGQTDEFLTAYGIMEFEIAEFEPGGFFVDEQQYQDVIVHEMGHVIGIGTLWDDTGNVDGNYIASGPPTVPPGLPNPAYDPGFTGAGAVAEYSTLTGSAETVVPIANTGGPGNYNGHWREIVFNNELMTPYAAGLELLSRMTAASLGDIGYTVDVDSAAVDQDYQLTRISGELEQTAPGSVSYVDGTDFLVFNGSVAGDVTGPVEAVDLALVDPTTSTSGCEAADFAGFTPGNIALLQRGACAFVDKVDNAEAAGAIAVVMFNQGDSADPARTGIFSGTSNAGIPAIGTTFALGQTFAGTAGLVLRVAVDTETGPFLRGTITPRFEEEILQPIGTIDPSGKITLNGE